MIKENDNVVFNEDGHSYVDKQTGMKCISVTQLIEKFSQPFDAEYWASIKALESILSPEDYKSIKDKLSKRKKFDDKILQKFDISPEVFIKTKDEILENWRNKNLEACERGTKLHKIKEELNKKGSVKELAQSGLTGNYKYIKSNIIKPGESGVYSELLLHYLSNGIRIGGQADLVVLEGNDVYIFEYKFNKEIKKSSYFNVNTKKRQMMQYPLNSIQDSNYFHYQLQLSLYARMIEEINPDFVIKGLIIIHYDHNDKMTLYNVEYMRKELDKLFTFYKNQLIREAEYEKIKPIEF